ncbi:MAG: hypothetical protein HRU19_12890 [Pseudobacteriovorax sp.]|nr:hypothetical protein [Pseudobacteriovorax sp.]
MLKFVISIIVLLNTGWLFAHEERGLRCDLMKRYKSNCSELSGQENSLCKVCRKQASCFVVFDGKKREFCQAYFEKSSCFMAFSESKDISWCQTLQESKSCFMAFSGKDRQACEAGHIPKRHQRWKRLGAL